MNHRFSKLLTFALLIIITANVEAQRLVEKKQSKSAGEHIHTYSFTPVEDGIYTVKIVNPEGDLQTVAMDRKELKAHRKMDLMVDTKGWKAGHYHLIAESEQGRVTLKKLYFKPEKKLE